MKKKTLDKKTICDHNGPTQKLKIETDGKYVYVHITKDYGSHLVWNTVVIKYDEEEDNYVLVEDENESENDY